jgi:hypothetical protein
MSGETSDVKARKQPVAVGRPRTASSRQSRAVARTLTSTLFTSACSAVRVREGAVVIAHAARASATAAGATVRDGRREFAGVGTDVVREEWIV